jgi:hypothetical protein
MVSVPGYRRRVVSRHTMRMFHEPHDGAARDAHGQAHCQPAHHAEHAAEQRRFLERKHQK